MVGSCWCNLAVCNILLYLISLWETSQKTSEGINQMEPHRINKKKISVSKCH